MQCPECDFRFEILEQKLHDFTESAFGCPVKGNWPQYTARMYIDNIELLECGCGVCLNVPELDKLRHSIYGTESAKMSLDPYSDLIYLGTWDDDSKSWVVSKHREQ